MNTDKIFAESIAKEYAPKDNSKIVALKKLDNKAKLPAIIFAYSFGIVSSMVLGLGMCMAMGVIGSGAVSTAVGIVLGITAIVTQWLKDGCRESVEEITKIIYECIFGLEQWEGCYEAVKKI